MRKLLTLLGIGMVISYGNCQSIKFYENVTEEHQQVQGTNIYLIPPESFSASNQFKGFQNPQDQTSMIMVMTIPGPYSEVSKGFQQSQMLEARGMTLVSKEVTQVYGLEGLFIYLEQEANGLTFGKSILVYGDSTSTTMINGIHLKDSIDLGQQIKTAVLSTFVNNELTVDPRNELDYTLDETKGNLKFASTFGNGMLFNRDGKIPTTSSDSLNLISDKSFQKVQIEDRQQFCKNRIQELPQSYQLLDEKSLNAISLDGLDGFELIATNLDNPGEELYQVIVFMEDGGYFIFIGSYQKGDTIAQNDIIKVIKTFARK